MTEKRRQYQKKWRKDNPDKVRSYKRKTKAKRKKHYSDWMKQYYKSDRGFKIIRNGYLKRTYGITLDQYNAMYVAQDGGCAICGGTNKDGRRLMVDHNHRTGKVRALLCNKCNIAVGHYENGKESVEEYLRKFD